MDKAKALKIGKAFGILAWDVTKILVRLSFVVVVFLVVGWFKLLITAAFGGFYSQEDADEESEYWWWINHGDPNHLYDKNDDRH